MYEQFCTVLKTIGASPVEIKNTNEIFEYVNVNFTSNTKKELTPKKTLLTEIHNALTAHLFLFFGATLLFGFMLGVFCSNLIK